MGRIKQHLLLHWEKVIFLQSDFYLVGRLVDESTIDQVQLVTIQLELHLIFNFSYSEFGRPIQIKLVDVDPNLRLPNLVQCLVECLETIFETMGFLDLFIVGFFYFLNHLCSFALN